ncbi:hypothetical protein CRM95_00135 [Burkholderia gladioli]|nr:hypothetical protein CRM95_00135 [Burkholderia gladioli]
MADLSVEYVLCALAFLFVLVTIAATWVASVDKRVYRVIVIQLISFAKFYFLGAPRESSAMPSSSSLVQRHKA